MVYVDDNQLDQVQYLLEQSSIGNHILFDNETIKRVAPNNKCDAKTDIEIEVQENAERLMEELILCPSIDSKLTFLANLDRRTYDEVASVYLSIVENTAQENHRFVH